MKHKITDQTSSGPFNYIYTLGILVTSIDLNSKGKPRFYGIMQTISSQQPKGAQSCVQLLPAEYSNKITILPQQPTQQPVAILFGLTNVKDGGIGTVPVMFPQVTIYDSSGNPVPCGLADVTAKLVGMVIPFNSSLGAEPYASQFINIKNPIDDQSGTGSYAINATMTLLLDSGSQTFEASVPANSILVVDQNTKACLDSQGNPIPWRFAFYIYYSFNDPYGNSYSGTAIWDPYVDNSSC